MKNTLFATIIISLFSLSAVAQAIDTIAMPPNKIYSAVEMEPSFPGGLDKLYSFIQSGLKYRGHAKGKVYVSFVVERDGSLSDIKVQRGISEDADAAAIDIMSRSPKWTPGIQNNRPVRVQYTIPINFE